MTQHVGQLARWFYPFGSGAHCNNYYYSTCMTQRVHLGRPAFDDRTWQAWCRLA
jgi:hypothetical protein